ncbi:hypothetical protein A2U01_0079125, partial [Trifolium medium]|nr:hypothetical protein [Trifolium medium]
MAAPQPRFIRRAKREQAIDRNV